MGGIAAGVKKVACGVNSNVHFHNMASRHAEMDALNKIKNKRELPKVVDIFVVRFAKGGTLGESRPCCHCLQSLAKSRLRIKHVYYSTNDGSIVREKFDTMMESPLTYISSGARVCDEDKWLNKSPGPINNDKKKIDKF